MNKVLVAFLAIFAIRVSAQELSIYTPTALSARESTNQVTLLHFHAKWCPICRKQDKILSEISSENKFSKIAIVQADYDTEKELEKRFNVKGQSTLILLKGSKEIDRSQGEYSKRAIEDLLVKASH